MGPWNNLYWPLDGVQKGAKDRNWIHTCQHVQMEDIISKSFGHKLNILSFEHNSKDEKGKY